MIVFSDSFSQACVAEACSASPQLLNRLALELTLPIFNRPLDNEGHVIGPPAIEPLSTLRRTLLLVSPRDLIEHIPKEIAFVRQQCLCNVYGQPTGEWQRIINGVYYNHGSNESPDWQSHT
ncbi:hypothetical protein [Shewanella sp. GXUN23E]|uniref:hypothetical protein n=1 Tax=Shewanella sp. GXUN23E TaxID=3422498 RepID=UPI003D7E6785